jgi:hypothetical protein
LPQNAESRKNEAQPIIPAEKRKIEEIKVKLKIVRAKRLLEVKYSMKSTASQVLLRRKFHMG